MSTARIPLAVRFWRKVDAPSPDACWTWEGARFPTGYGAINAGGREGPLLAHRVAYELLTGQIPQDLELDHLCRVRHCVNPAHLEPVTHAENLRRAAPEVCVNGHPYREGSYRRRPSGTKRCLICSRERNRRYHEKKKAGAAP